MNGNTTAIVCLMLLAITPSATAGWFGPDDYSDCIFEGLKGVGNDKAVIAVMAACQRQYPGKPEPGWLDPGSYDACISRNMKGIVNDKATMAVEDACRRLYDND